MFSVFRHVSPNNVCFVAWISVTILPQFGEALLFLLFNEERENTDVSVGW